MKLTKGSVVSGASLYTAGTLADEHRYIAKSLPSRGDFLKEKDHLPGQLKME